MIIIFVIVGCLATFLAFVVFVAMTMYDLRIIQASRRYMHFRRRPFVSVVIKDATTDAAIRSIKRNEYRKHEIIFTGETIKSDFVLELNGNAIMPPLALRHAIQQMHTLQNCEFVEIKPIIPRPENIRQIFSMYKQVSIAPLISVRAQLGIEPFTYLSWPTLHSAKLEKSWRSYTYQVTTWLLSLLNMFVLLYVGFMAVWLAQPDFLLLYLGAFWLWITVAIWDYPHLSLTEKLVYTILAPVSIGYFLLASLWLPFILPLHVVSKFTGRFFTKSFDKAAV